MMRSIFLFLILLVFVPLQTFAASPEEEREAYREKMHEKLSALTKDLGKQEQQHFYVIYTNYALMNTVKTVQGDVENAVKACGEKNPDMKDAVSKRFKEWNGALEPVMKEAQANLDNMIVAQEYAPKKDIEDIFKVIDETREKTESQIEKIPVSTPEACEYLLEQMGDTQETMIRLLRQTLVSFPQAFPEESGEEAKEGEADEAGDSEESKTEEEKKAE